MTSHLYLQNPPKGGRAAAPCDVATGHPLVAHGCICCSLSIAAAAMIHVPCTASAHHRPTSSVPRECPYSAPLQRNHKGSSRLHDASRHRPLWPRAAGLEVCQQLEVGNPIQSHTGVRYAVMLPTSEAPWCVVVCTCNDQHAMPQHTGSQPLEHSCDYY